MKKKVVKKTRSCAGVDQFDGSLDDQILVAFSATYFSLKVMIAIHLSFRRGY